MKMRRAPLAAFVVVTASLGLSACGSALFVASLTKQHACPCDADYVCINEVCELAAAKQVGDPCDADEECGEGLVCRDKYGADCQDFELDYVCTTAPDEHEKQCRTACDPVQSWVEQCSPGEVCFDDPQNASNEGGYCQVGTCSGDTDCGLNAICVGRTFNPDPSGENGSGQCYRTCDPFNCAVGVACDGCTPDDITGDDLDEALSCVPFFNDSPPNKARTACAVAGPVAAQAVCSFTEVCQPGSFCLITDAVSGTGLCRTYCRLGGGAPACNAGQICTGIVNDDVDLGFCQ